MNDVSNEVLGKEALTQENLDGVVDLGAEIFNANAVDRYVKSLVNHIGKVIFVNRPYSGGVPSVLMDGWEYGSVLEKIQADLPVAVENKSWELTDGTDYSPNVFHQPSVSAKFFNQRVTFEVEMSFTERQLKQSFSSAEQLNGFLSMLYNSIDRSMTVKTDSLIMRTINNMIAETIWDEYKDTSSTPATLGSLSAKSGIRAVNLLYLYNQKFGESLTKDVALLTPEFIRFASMQISLYINRMSKISSLFNVGGKDRFTTEDMLHVVFLTDFMSSAGAYLQSDTFHENFTALPKAEIVPYWQGSGVDYSFDSVSKINVKSSAGNAVEASGIIGVLFDRDSLGVANLDKRVTTNYNAKAEFFNNFYKFDAGYFNDLNENFVVFFMA